MYPSTKISHPIRSWASIAWGEKAGHVGVGGGERLGASKFSVTMIDPEGDIFGGVD